MTPHILRTCALSLTIIGISMGITAQSEHQVTCEAYQLNRLDESTYSLELFMTIDESLHIQANADVDDHLIPTQVNFNTPACIEIDRIDFSPARPVSLSDSEHAQMVFCDTLRIQALFHSSCSMDLAAIPIQGSMIYQACGDRHCYFPRTLNFNLGKDNNILRILQ